jgi:hypothetical protein
VALFIHWISDDQENVVTLIARNSMQQFRLEKIIYNRNNILLEKDEPYQKTALV